MSEKIAHERVPVVEETVTVDRRRNVTSTVRARTVTHENLVTVDEPMLSEQVDIERVPIDRFVDAPLPVRQEGETTIIPILEEVVVVEKRLKLVEEVRLTKRQTIKHEPQTIAARRQEVIVDRLPAPEKDPQK